MEASPSYLSLSSTLLWYTLSYFEFSVQKLPTLMEGTTVRQTIVDPRSKLWAAVSSNHRLAIIPRDLFLTNHKTFQNSGGGFLMHCIVLASTLVFKGYKYINLCYHFIHLIYVIICIIYYVFCDVYSILFMSYAILHSSFPFFGHFFDYDYSSPRSIEFDWK
jgi:hypothetical protein